MTPGESVEGPRVSSLFRVWGSDSQLVGDGDGGEECQEGLGVGWRRGPQHLNRALEEFGKIDGCVHSL